MPYNPGSDTYVCDVCGYESKPYDSVNQIFPCDKEHENIWECEDCGKVICSACFKRHSTPYALTTMLKHKAYYFNDSEVKFLFTGKILCPDCYEKAKKKILLDTTLKMIDHDRDRALESPHSDIVVPKDGGPYSLYCQVCHCWVPNTANAEMMKEGCYSHSHSCGYVGDDEVKVYDDARLNRKLQGSLTLPHSCCAYCMYRKEKYPNGHEECASCPNDRNQPYFVTVPVWAEEKSKNK